MNYTYIFELIDLSNAPKNDPNFQPEKAITALIALGIYSVDGDLISDDEKIINYYQENWC